MNTRGLTSEAIRQIMYRIFKGNNSFFSVCHALPCRARVASKTAPGTVCSGGSLLESALTKCRSRPPRPKAGAKEFRGFLSSY